MATIEERIKALSELYAKATTRGDYQMVWGLVQGLEEDALAEQGILVKFPAQAVLPGFWARYYELRKFGGREEDIDDLYQQVNHYYELIVPETDLELAVNYGYLLSVVVGQLRRNHEEAKKIDRDISQLVKDTDNIALALRVINAHGLNAMQKNDWQGAIAIFTQAEQNFREAFDIPEDRQHLANTLNNRGLAKLNLSDSTESPVEKKNLIASTIVDLRNFEF